MTFAVAARTRKVSRRSCTRPTTGNILILHKTLCGSPFLLYTGNLRNGTTTSVIMTKCASADWPRIARVLVQRMREAFHLVEIRQWNFPGLCLPPLENAFTHVCDNCEITSKLQKHAVKIKNKAGNVSSKLPCAAQLQTTYCMKHMGLELNYGLRNIYT